MGDRKIKINEGNYNENINGVGLDIAHASRSAI